MVDLSLIRRQLEDVDTTAICDVAKETRVMSASIRCRSRNPRLCGPAFTVRCRDDFLGVLRAIELAAPGEIIIVDGGRTELALAGELFARAALVRGLGGIIIDGGYRDLGYVHTSDLPIYSRFVTPMAGTTTKLGELQTPVTCGGVTVAPGDLVIADLEGLIVLDPSTAADLIDAAASVKANEARIIERLDQGATLTDCLNLTEHVEHLTQGKPTNLRFTVQPGRDAEP